VLEVRRWAEIRRMKEVEGLSIHEIARRTGHDRNTVRIQSTRDLSRVLATTPTMAL
jgi:DNA-directed RNA polymerase specialized sigma24 family protein